MTMVPTCYMEVLKRHLPGVEHSSLRLITSGYANDVVVVDDRLVVRFAKQEWGVGSLAAERKVLELAGPRLTVRVPRWEMWSDDVVAYPILPGMALEAWDYLRFSDSDRRRIVGEIARFLNELHAIPATDVIAAGIGEAEGRSCGDGFEGLMDEARRLLFPIRSAAECEQMSGLFGEVRAGVLDAEYGPVLIHADLAACHLLWDGITPRLAGVIDFGCAGLGDPVLDVAALFDVYGDEFLGRLFAELPEARASVDRIRVYNALARLQEQVDTVNGVN